MTRFGKALSLTATTAAVCAASVMVSGTAEAASSPISACGGGSYHEIDSHKLGSVATIRLLYNGSTNCVVTWKTNPGGSSRLQAGIARQESDGIFRNYDIDDDNYTTYAGPAKASAAGRCIDWGGGATVNGVWTVWYSGPSHCG
ncbi:spore-associated protein A [Lentzea sp. BCCO 10_0856]|uniref:Spore-associated protein A n=1 Tax=Lentzea miocenica TaxID=3095431 RepID=A0ABU4THE8_9PSEU|nr:spore-associated protein A [Lentzea sp. BCCO 10_0856]MDX8037610.1 spore-associated protein A [Lentzea sp. BCCO 10_0856]